MKECIIDFTRFEDKKQCHKIIKEAVGDYDGSNLDALFDHLTSGFEPRTYMLVNTSLVSDELCDYAQSVIDTFTDAAAENDAISVKIEVQNQSKSAPKSSFFSKTDIY